MVEPHTSDPKLHASNANSLSTLFADWLPRGPDDVTMFLGDAALALGMREADLAREIGVSRATFSGWKARGAIPAAHASWFQQRFLPLVFATRDHPNFDMLHAGIPAVLHLLQRSNFNPFALSGLDRRSAINICYRYLGRLARIALFIQRRLPLDDPGSALQSEEQASRILEVVAASVAPAVFPGMPVSH